MTSSEDFSLCDSQTSIQLDGFETIDVRTIDLQDQNIDNPVELDGGACGNCGAKDHNRRTCKKSPKKVEPKKKKTTKKKPKKEKKPKKIKVKIKKLPEKTTKKMAKKVNNKDEKQFRNFMDWSKTVIFKSITENFDGNLIKTTDVTKKINVIDINVDNDYEILSNLKNLGTYRLLNKSKTNHKKITKTQHLNVDIEKPGITEQINKIEKSDYVNKEERFNLNSKTVLKSKLFPLTSNNFIKGPSGGYGGIKSISEDSKLMKYVADFKNLKELVKSSKADWRKIKAKKDSLYFNWVILENKPKTDNKSKPVLGYIRLKRDSWSKDFYLRIVIREEGRGTGKINLYNALIQLHRQLKSIYGADEASEYNIVAEVNVGNELGYRAFKRWGMNLDEGIYEKRWGNVYKFWSNIDKLIEKLNPDNVETKIPDIIDLKTVYKNSFERVDLVSSILNLQNYFSDELNARQVIQNISDLLAKEGHAVFIIPDSMTIKSWCNPEFNEYNGELINIKYTPNIIHSDKLFGARYRVKTFKETYNNDYLVKLDVFINLLNDYDFEVKFNDTMDSLIMFKDNPMFLDSFKETIKDKLSDNVVELLKFLRIIVVKNNHDLVLTSFEPKTIKIDMIGSGKTYKDIDDDVVKLINDEHEKPTIYYYLNDDEKCIYVGKITEIEDGTVFIKNNIDNTINTMGIDDIRYITHQELNHWGGDNFQFVKIGLDMKMSDCRKSALYFKNPDALWNMVKAPNKYKPFIYKNLDKYLIVYDKSPKAKSHYLVLPKQYLELTKLTKDDVDTLVEMQSVAVREILEDDIRTQYLLGFHRVNSQNLLHMHVISTDVKKNPHISEIKKKQFKKPDFIPVSNLIKHLKDGKSVDSIITV